MFVVDLVANVVVDFALDFLLAIVPRVFASPFLRVSPSPYIPRLRVPVSGLLFSLVE